MTCYDCVTKIEFNLESSIRADFSLFRRFYYIKCLKNVSKNDLNFKNIINRLKIIVQQKEKRLGPPKKLNFTIFGVLKYDLRHKCLNSYDNIGMVKLI